VSETITTAETPKDDYAYPEVIPSSETSVAQEDLNSFLPSPSNMPSLVPVSPPGERDLSSAPQPQMPEVIKTEEPAEIPVSKRYPARVRSKPKRLIEAM